MEVSDTMKSCSNCIYRLLSRSISISIIDSWVDLMLIRCHELVMICWCVLKVFSLCSEQCCKYLHCEMSFFTTIYFCTTFSKRPRSCRRLRMRATRPSVACIGFLFWSWELYLILLSLPNRVCNLTMLTTLTTLTELDQFWFALVGLFVAVCAWNSCAGDNGEYDLDLDKWKGQNLIEFVCSSDAAVQFASRLAD